jgi:ubiquinone/menaquinone biosynthesis C-methylase UbiE
MDQKQTFFDFAAEVGMTKHIGGLAATESLIYLCKINKDSYVLDVGCGVGQTACYLARKTGCKVMGVDIIEGMVEKSQQRAKRDGLTGQIEFRQANVQELPFENETFTTVISESVTAFPPDKAKAASEYFRVLKPGGYVGLNETTWLNYPPPQEIIDWVSQDFGMSAMPLTAENWEKLLLDAGFREIFTEVDEVDVKDESKGILKRYGCWGLLGILGRTFRLYVKNSQYREFVKSTREEGIMPESTDLYFGYGLYVGKKE